jgi:sec-independent protein translocase protein TatC
MTATTKTTGSKAAPGDSKTTNESLVGGGKVMSVFDHLAELRTRLMKSFAIIMVFFVIGFSYADKIMLVLKQPLQAALPPQANALHFTGPMDVFLVNIKVGFLAAVVLSCPVWMYQFWKFFEPALYPKERKYILPFSLVSVLLFFSGVLFCFYGILPMTMKWLMDLGTEVGTPIITVTDYVSLIMMMIFGFGVVFETPLILVLLGILDLVSADSLAAHRRLVIVLILIVAAIMTPPDPISQVALAVPVFAMYEAAILIIRLLKGKQNQTTGAITPTAGG